jgi:hypothetical protein
LEDSAAIKCELKIIELRVLAQQILLKMTVEVGLVTGARPRMTPMGSATSTMLSSGSSLYNADSLSVFDLSIQKL